MSIALPETVFIEGSAGAIEAVVDRPEGNPLAVAVCCHPHPLFGGTLTNKVVHTVARAFTAGGAETIRFNFRGVGASQGLHDKGRGELDDLLKVARWSRSHRPGLPLWLAGFSFGAWVALRAHDALRPSRLVTIAPPVGRWDFSDIARPDCPWLIVQGEADELVNIDAVSRWVESLGCGDDLIRLPGTDHFFHGQLHRLREVVADFLSSAT